VCKSLAAVAVQRLLVAHYVVPHLVAEMLQVPKAQVQVQVLKTSYQVQPKYTEYRELSSAAALPGEKERTKCSILSKTVLLLNQNHTQKTHFVYIFIALASLSSCPFFKYLHKMSAHYTNTEIETCSLFVDSSVNNVLLQTNTDFTSHFSLTAQTHCYKAVKLCN